LFNRTRSRAEGFLAQCPQARVWPDYDEFLARGEFDAVTICALNILHAEMAIAALRAGKHVLVEKPMAMNLREAQTMIDAADAAGKVLMVHQNVRDRPAHIKAREMVAGGDLGRIYQLNAVFGHGGAVYPESPSSRWFLDAGLAGMGCMGDIGIHKADIIRYVTGSEVVSAAAFVTSSSPEVTVEDNAAAVFSLANGAIATLTTSWKAVERIKWLTIFGEEGTLFIDLYAADKVRLRKKGSAEIVAVPIPAYVGNDEYFSKSIHDFVRSVRGEIECPIDGREGYRSLEVVLAAVLSARTGEVVRLPLPQDAGG